MFSVNCRVLKVRFLVFTRGQRVQGAPGIWSESSGSRETRGAQGAPGSFAGAWLALCWGFCWGSAGALLGSCWGSAVGSAGVLLGFC
jgi:hypothetical protein